MRFLKGAGSVLLAVVLALAWPGTNLLKDLGFVNDSQRIVIFVLLIVVLALQQTYLVLPKPVDRGGLVEDRRSTIQHYLEGLRNEYYEKLKSLHSDKTKPLPVVRVNIMLPTKRAKGVFGSYLRIYYDACPPGVVYTNDERVPGWKKKEGICGWAWTGERGIYDSVRSDLSLPAGQPNESQTGIMSSIKSWLGIPIWYDGVVVGVLNLDSKFNVDETKFADSPVYRLAEAYARGVGALCPRDGVKA